MKKPGVAVYAAFDENQTSYKLPPVGPHSAKIRSLRCARSRAVSTSAAWLPGCSEVAQPVCPALAMQSFDATKGQHRRPWMDLPCHCPCSTCGWGKWRCRHGIASRETECQNVAMKTLAEIEHAVEELPPAQKTELLLFVAKSLRGQQAPLPKPRLFSDEQLRAWMDEDEEAMRRFRAGS